MSRTKAQHRTPTDKSLLYASCGQGHCEKPALEDVDVQLCERHLAKAWAAYQLMHGTPEAPPEPDPEPDLDSDTAPGAVYFIRVRDELKIGWTSNVPNRMRTLNPDALFHIEQGTRQDERRYHQMFSEHLVHGREWFACNDETTALVDNIRRSATTNATMC